MSTVYFSEIFDSAPLPVVVVRNEPGLPVAFINVRARIMLDAMRAADNLQARQQAQGLGDIVRVWDQGMLDNMAAALVHTGSLLKYQISVLDSHGKKINISIDANQIFMGGHSYFVLYLSRGESEEAQQESEGDVLETLFQVGSQSEEADESINHVLAYLGNLVHASRVYIFEEISEEITSNTYEWCAPGIKPAMDGLQELRKEDYNYDLIIECGAYIADDVRDLPDGDREILEAQGIHSLAILALKHGDKALGYIGFDDCNAPRKWTQQEVSILQNAASFIVSLIKRRNAERKLRRSHSVLQTITDSTDNVVYVTDLQTMELVFLNDEMARSLGRNTEELIGQVCWKVIQKDMTGPCPFCPLPKMLEEGYDKSGKTYTWEFENTITGHWYLLKDSIVEWTDGRKVHIETAIDITHQKDYEAHLRQYASVDTMTGAYKREWGRQLLSELVHSPEIDDGASLIFLDVDGLKITNDTFGHDAGDEMLINMIQVVRSCIRKSDIICRWGGDEFLILLKCNEVIAQRIITNIYQKLEAINETGEHPYKLDFSYGMVSLLDARTESLDAVITKADKAMYKHKMGRRQ